MDKYNYRKAMCESIRQFIDNEEADVSKYSESDWDNLYDRMFVSDGVTGNASGSFTFNRWDAEENLCHNLDLLEEACEEFCCEPDIYNPEACDVTIRCWLLGECLGIVRKELGY